VVSRSEEGGCGSPSPGTGHGQNSRSPKGGGAGVIMDFVGGDHASKRRG